jgi:hypothetical protein
MPTQCFLFLVDDKKGRSTTGDENGLLHVSAE